MQRLVHTAAAARVQTRSITTTKLRSSFFLRQCSTQNTAKKNYLQLDIKDEIAIVRIDCPGAKVNTLSAEMQAEFEQTLNQIENDPKIKAAVIISNKEDSFIAGADIKMLAACKNAQDLTNISVKGQQVMNMLECGKPKVAAIHGNCLGGGLEVALACHYRIATSSPKTVLGLPEVMLGLLPGAGGTQRLPRLVGIRSALDMILTGKQVKPHSAKKINLINDIADKNALEKAAIDAAKRLAKEGVSKAKKPFSIVNFALEENPLGRNLVFSKAKEKVLQTTQGNYPAPLKILQCVQAGVEKGFAAGSQVEAVEFGNLGQTTESKALISIFNGKNACSKNKFGSPSRPVKTIGVLGAGLMGAGITAVSMKKYKILLKDTTTEALARGQKQIFDGLNEGVKRKSLSSFDRDTFISNITDLTDADASWPQHFAKADLVVEAVFEDMGVKHKVIKQFEEYLPEHAIFATNTSALPINEIAKASKRPERVIGMHYFSPVEKMPLLEIITTEQTLPDVAAAAFDVGLKQGKTVIVVKDVPGFYVNRSLGPYMVETMGLLKEGVDPKFIDKALKKFGFPVGPISLADEVGIDVAYHVQGFLGKHLGVRMGGGGPELLEKMVQSGFLGRKKGKGFFLYEKGSKDKNVNPEAQKMLEAFRTKSESKATEEEVQQRMAFRFINEAAYCLQDGIIASPVDGDIGAVFGIGFPPFLGGPFRYVDTFGIKKFVDLMCAYRDRLGPHFEPAPILVDYAKTNRKFHTD